MDQVVLDASVGLKWIFDEENSDKARTIRARAGEGKIRIVVPEFFYSEVANICSLKVKKKIMSFEEVNEAFDNLIEFPLERYSDRELSDVAMGNAIQYRISVYDALYLSLAEIYTSPLITADRGLLKACRGRFDFIESLENFEF